MQSWSPHSLLHSLAPFTSVLLQEMGCDYVLGSVEKEDKCLRCQNGQSEMGHECKEYSGYLKPTTIGKSSVGDRDFIIFLSHNPTILYFFDYSSAVPSF